MYCLCSNFHQHAFYPKLIYFERIIPLKPCSQLPLEISYHTSKFNRTSDFEIELGIMFSNFPVISTCYKILKESG